MLALALTDEHVSSEGAAPPSPIDPLLILLHLIDLAAKNLLLSVDFLFVLVPPLIVLVRVNLNLIPHLALPVLLYSQYFQSYHTNHYSSIQFLLLEPDMLLP